MATAANEPFATSPMREFWQLNTTSEVWRDLYVWFPMIYTAPSLFLYFIIFYELICGGLAKKSPFYKLFCVCMIIVSFGDFCSFLKRIVNKFFGQSFDFFNVRIWRHGSVFSSGFELHDLPWCSRFIRCFRKMEVFLSVWSYFVCSTVSTDKSSVARLWT